MILKNVRFLSRVSKIFQPIEVIPKNAEIKKQDVTSKSQRLMMEMGIIRQSSPGCFHFLPLGVKSLEKLISLIDEEMQKIGGQKVIFPTLTDSKLWDISGRLKLVSSELFQIKDRHNHDYILSPTYEEAASSLLASLSPISYKQLPLKLYQISNKFRDEIKPRFGLIRAKQFLMKDMYSFDMDPTRARETYDEICNSYDNIFKQIGINFTKVLGSSGHMGGDLSHEYHYKADVGEDKILNCTKCGYSGNVEICGEKECPECGNQSVEVSVGIEVGHTFFLGDKYSKSLKAKYLTKEGKPEVLQMGSYGLGLTRILAAAVEVLSNEQEIRWPEILAPYRIIIILPKSGSKEETYLNPQFVESLFTKLESINNLKNNVLVDDRTTLTIGRRFLDARKTGYPFIITLGKKITQNPPLIELFNLSQNTQIYLEENDLLNYIKTQS